MKLMDVLPRDPAALHAMMHECEPSPAERDARVKDLEPIELAVRLCFKECGPSTEHPNVEFKAAMAMACIIDALLQACTKKASA